MTRRVRALTVAVFAVLTLGSCGAVDSGRALSQVGFFREVAAAQTESHTAHISMEMTVEGQTVNSTGQISGSERPEDLAMSMVMDMGAAPGGPASMEIRLVDMTMYMSMGDLTEGKFVKVDLADEGNPIGKVFAPMLKQSNFAEQLKIFEKAVVSFEQTGDPEEIDGVQTLPYVITIDTDKMAAAAAELDWPEIPTEGLPETIVATYFVGPDDLPRRVVQDMGVSSMTMDFTRWGAPVDIVAPSDDEISDIDPFQENPA